MNIEDQTDLTSLVYGELQDAYNFFNRRLFESRLPQCIVTLTHQRTSYGYFRSKPFARREELDAVDEWDAAAEEGSDDSAALEQSRPGVDEISLNVFSYRERTRDEILSTLVHEMVHLEQFHYGKPPKRPSHNREWGDMMKRVGLHPSSTGAPDGKEPGRRVSHYVVADGPFETVVADCAAQLDWVGLLRRRKKKARTPKVTYECEACEVKVRGKTELHIVCGECGERMEES